MLKDIIKNSYLDFNKDDIKDLKSVDRVTINTYYKYRLDNISKDFLGNRDYLYFLGLYNDIKSIDFIYEFVDLNIFSYVDLLDRKNKIELERNIKR